MKLLQKFEYHRPKTLKEALEILNKYEGQAKVLAGGTDLLVKMKKGLTSAPRAIVDINFVEGLNSVEECDGEIAIGALTRISEIANSATIMEKAPVLAEAARSIGSWQIRNRGTIGGNLCNASPAADMAPPLLVLDASLKVVSTEGERVMSVEEFFKGPGLTALKRNELLIEIRIPVRPNTSSCFMKLGRRKAFTLSVVSTACSVNIEDGIINDIKLALGAVAPTPIRVREVEKRLKGIKVDDVGSLEGALKEVKDYVRPITDIRATAEYRREMSYVLAKRAVMEALKRSRK